MSKALAEKLIGFLHWYRDLYGGEVRLPRGSVAHFPKALQFLQAENETPDRKSKSEEQVRKEKILTEFYGQIKDCTRCRLAEHRTQVVFGVGNPDAEVMFVGEAPGRDEDLQGEPFVGRAGQLLNKMLEHIHLKRRDVYIANIIKCRPPNNRDPRPDEVEQCIGYLHRQIEIVQPRLLVALGRVAGQNLLHSNLSLSKMREHQWEYQGIPLLVTYHPAAILRNMNLLPVALQDFQKIKSYLPPQKA